jgi:DNA-binding transcriptional MocR family regulator
VALLQLAAEQRTGVKFVPGPVCNGPADCIRLSFSFYTAPEIREGVRRLAATLRAYLQEQR